MPLVVKIKVFYQHKADVLRNEAITHVKKDAGIQKKGNKLLKEPFLIASSMCQRTVSSQNFIIF